MQFLHPVRCVISIIFTINVGTGTYFVFYIYMNFNKETDPKGSFNYQTTLSY